MLQNQTQKLPASVPARNHISYISSQARRQSIDRLIRHLDESGKVCPKAWCWERFFILFKPRYEPCWLSSWWRTPIEEKKELFRKQLFYLAYRTSRYPEACQFLHGLDDSHWLYEQNYQPKALQK